MDSGNLEHVEIMMKQQQLEEQNESTCGCVGEWARLKLCAWVCACVCVERWNECARVQVFVRVTVREQACELVACFQWGELTNELGVSEEWKWFSSSSFFLPNYVFSTSSKSWLDVTNLRSCSTRQSKTLKRKKRLPLLLFDGKNKILILATNKK